MIYKKAAGTLAGRHSEALRRSGEHEDLAECAYELYNALAWHDSRALVCRPGIRSPPNAAVAIG